MLIQIILLHGFDVCISIVRLKWYVINNKQTNKQTNKLSPRVKTDSLAATSATKDNHTSTCDLNSQMFTRAITPETKQKKEMFYLTTHSTHFIYRYIVKDHSARERKEGTVLFNDALNTFYVRLYGVKRG